MSSRVCPSCVIDNYLKKIVTESAIHDVECDFCKSCALTLELYELVPLFEQMLDDFYECSSQTMAVTIYDYAPDGEALADIVENYILPDPAYELADLISDEWFDWSSHEHRFGEDPYFIRKSSMPIELNHEWRDLEQSLRSTARLVNPFVASTLEKIFSPLFSNAARPAIITAGPESQINMLFRARVFQSAQKLESELCHPERALGPPPSKLASLGRMNAKGIPVFYGATHKQIAIAEVRPPVGSYVVSGAFKLTRDLKLLDLKKLSEIEPPLEHSLFDPSTKDIDARYRFLKLLEDKLIMPVMPEAADEGYLITQAIADFLATHPMLNIDGIIFSSSQTDNSCTEGVNVTLFTKASAVYFSSESEKGESLFDLWELDDESDSSWVRPTLYESIPPHPISIKSLDELAPPLQLDRDSLTIHQVTGVSYLTDDHGIYLRKR